MAIDREARIFYRKSLMLVSLFASGLACGDAGGGGGADAGADAGVDRGLSAAECSSLCADAAAVCPGRVDAACATRCEADDEAWEWAAVGTAEDPCAVFFVGARSEVPCDTFMSLPCIEGPDTGPDTSSPPDAEPDSGPDELCIEACDDVESCYGPVVTCAQNCRATAPKLGWSECVVEATTCDLTPCLETYCSEGCLFLIECLGTPVPFAECLDSCVAAPLDMLRRTNVACGIANGCVAECF